MYMSVIATLILGRIMYLRSYLRNKKSENRVILVNRSSIYLRMLSLCILLPLFVSNMYCIYLKDIIYKTELTQTDKFLFLAWFVLAIIKIYLEIQNEVITDKAVFIRGGNFYFSELESYSWQISHELKFGEKDVKYDSLKLHMRPKNLYESIFRAKISFEIDLHVKKSDVDLVSDILEKVLQSKSLAE